jgi:hypothetical protein
MEAIMHRTTPHRARVLPRALVLALGASALLFTAGCGGESGSVTPAAGGSPASVSASASPSASPSASASASPSPTDPAESPGCTPEAEPAPLTAADSGRTVCVTVDAVLRLNLAGDTARPWGAVDPTGGVLEPTNSGIVPPPAGSVIAAFQAVKAGTTQLSSFRPLCPQSTTPGKMSCKGLEDWNVTVVVTAK